MGVDIVNAVLDVVLPPSAIIFLILTYPVIAFFQFWSFVLRSVFPEKVHGKVVLITGASSGIGEHIAYEYAKKGARLVLVARRENLLKEVADRARNLGAPHVHVIVADVAKEEDCRRFITETLNQYGHLDHLVLNAGIGNSFFFEEAKDVSAMQQVWDVNFWGMLYATYHALPHLKRSKGKILVIDSTAAWLPFPRMSIYNASKAALFQLFDTLRVELGNSVFITIVQPGTTESEFTKGKAVTSDGHVESVPEDARDAHFGPIPIARAQRVAKASVNGVLRSHRYVVVPFWYSAFVLYRLLVPEFISYSLRFLYVRKADGRRHVSKAALEMPALKSVLYPQSITKTPQSTTKTE